MPQTRNAEPNTQPPRTLSSNLFSLKPQNPIAGMLWPCTSSGCSCWHRREAILILFRFSAVCPGWCYAFFFHFIADSLRWIYALWGWRSVAHDLKTHPHVEGAFVKKRPNGHRCISRRRRILKTHWVKTHLGRRRRILKTHWVAQTHCEDTLDMRRPTLCEDALERRRRIAKTHWISEDGFRRHVVDALPSRCYDIAATNRLKRTGSHA